MAAKDDDKSGKKSGRCVSRGIALFIGLFSLVNLLALFLGNGGNQNVWWVDFSQMEIWFGIFGKAAGALIQLSAGVGLVLWAVFPGMRLFRRVFTCVAVALSALAALQNAFAYWSTLQSGSLYSAGPIPLSLVVFVVLGLLVWRMATCPRRLGIGIHIGRFFAVVGVLLACVLTFPLIQIGFFGTTDYRREADVEVVMGARVYEDGTLSRALRERMDTAIEVYEQGLVSKMIVSGGIETSGANEALAMAQYAEQAGVPSSDIIVDEQGSSTKESVTSSLEIVEENGFETMLVTSSFYHMPRIKMLYLMEGADVYTVPTVGQITSNGTFKALWREIPAWWYYWVENALML